MTNQIALRIGAVFAYSAMGIIGGASILETLQQSSPVLQQRLKLWKSWHEHTPTMGALRKQNWTQRLI